MRCKLPLVPEEAPKKHPSGDQSARPAEHPREASDPSPGLTACRIRRHHAVEGCSRPQRLPSGCRPHQPACPRRRPCLLPSTLRRQRLLQPQRRLRDEVPRNDFDNRHRVPPPRALAEGAAATSTSLFLIPCSVGDETRRGTMILRSLFGICLVLPAVNCSSPNPWSEQPPANSDGGLDMPGRDLRQDALGGMAETAPTIDMLTTTIVVDAGPQVDAATDGGARADLASVTADVPSEYPADAPVTVDTRVCETGATRCTNAGTAASCPDGSAWIETACPNGCLAGKCNVCDPRAAPTCTAGSVRTCKSDGTELLSAACQGGCSGGVCCGQVGQTCCPSGRDCLSGLYCRTGKCETLREAGAGCSANGECQSGNCVDGVCCNSSSCPSCKSCGAGGACDLNVASGKTDQGCDSPGASCDGTGRCVTPCTGIQCDANQCIPTQGACMASILLNPAAPCPPDVCNRPSATQCNTRWRFQRTAAMTISDLSAACIGRFEFLRMGLCDDSEIKAITSMGQSLRVIYSIHTYDPNGREADVQAVGEGVCQ
jgi:hypothetical protein